MVGGECERFESVASRLRAAALAYPGAYEESPWGERVVKVNKKIFLFVGAGPDRLALSVKLPRSAGAALELPFATPTGYGLGKSGWVTARFEAGQSVPLGILLEWLDESYRSIAPVKLLQELDARGTAGRVGSRRSGAGAARATSAERAKPTRACGPVLLVGDDPLRLGRARKALEAEGLLVVATLGLAAASPERIARERPSLIIVDLSRHASLALELASHLSSDRPRAPRLLLTGVRDAAQRREIKLRAPHVLDASREPPGDPAFVARLLSFLPRATRSH